MNSVTTANQFPCPDVSRSTTKRQKTTAEMSRMNGNLNRCRSTVAATRISSHRSISATTSRRCECGDAVPAEPLEERAR